MYGFIKLEFRVPKQPPSKWVQNFIGDLRKTGVNIKLVELFTPQGGAHSFNVKHRVPVVEPPSPSIDTSNTFEFETPTFVKTNSLPNNFSILASTSDRIAT